MSTEAISEATFIREYTRELTQQECSCFRWRRVINGIGLR